MSENIDLRQYYMIQKELGSQNLITNLVDAIIFDLDLQTTLPWHPSSLIVNDISYSLTFKEVRIPIQNNFKDLIKAQIWPFITDISGNFTTYDDFNMIDQPLKTGNYDQCILRAKFAKKMYPVIPFYSINPLNMRIHLPQLKEVLIGF